MNQPLTREEFRAQMQEKEQAAFSLLKNQTDKVMRDQETLLSAVLARVKLVDMFIQTCLKKQQAMLSWTLKVKFAETQQSPCWKPAIRSKY